MFFFFIQPNNDTSNDVQRTERREDARFYWGQRLQVVHRLRFSRLCFWAEGIIHARHKRVHVHTIRPVTACIVCIALHAGCSGADHINHDACHRPCQTNFFFAYTCAGVLSLNIVLAWYSFHCTNARCSRRLACRNIIAKLNSCTFYRKWNIILRQKVVAENFYPRIFPSSMFRRS